MDPIERPADCCPSPQAEAVYPTDLAAKARTFKALGDPLRLQLLHHVRDREVCVCDLMTAFGMAQGTLSHHLGVLHHAGLVTARRQGRWNNYQATAVALGTLEVFGREMAGAGS